MPGKTLWKLIISALVLVWCVYSLIPFKSTPFEAYIQTRATANQIAFQEVLQKAQNKVDTQEVPSLFVGLQKVGKSDGIDYALYFPDVNLVDIKNRDKRNDILLTYLLQQPQSKIKQGLDLKGGLAFTLKIGDSEIASKEDYRKRAQMDKAIDIMGRRINGLGVAEPLIRAVGDDRIEIQLPGLSMRENPDAIANLKKPAKLTFHKVHRTLNPEMTKEVPLGYKILSQERAHSETGEVIEEKFFVKIIPEMSGSVMKEAFPSMTELGAYQINISFTDEGTKRFNDVTASIAEENLEPRYASLPDYSMSKYGRLAIILDGDLYSAPRVTEAIPNGRARISGNFSQREAIELANVLNNPLEFELKLEQMYEVGPSLAEGARDASLKAFYLGAGLVSLFMVVYYGVGGIIAMISVALNILMILGVFASLQVTFTLAGIAAIILTIGMAVDANILIFERMREELKSGKSLPIALLGGYDKAFSTIVDSNLTTLLTAGILFWLGTGPIKGFGVTLAIGILATMFCALVFSRGLLELLIDRAIIKKMLTHALLQETRFNFLKMRRSAFIFSWLVVAFGIAFVAMKGDRIYGIDFTGGDEITLAYEKQVPIQSILNIAKDQNLGEIIPVYQDLLSSNQKFLKIQTKENQSQFVFKALEDAFPEARFTWIGETQVGGTVSQSIKWDALLALACSLIGIVIYVAFRFEFGFGIGALVSTVHDILMTIGIFVLLGGQFTAPMVAAILMIIGYSINDTIVIFDRIREELKNNARLNLFDAINLSINRTLSRTLLTSFTTLLTAVSLYIFGAGAIDDFALVFIIGILTGTFSSIFIASPVFFWWHKGNRKHVEEREFKPEYEWQSATTISKAGALK